MFAKLLPQEISLRASNWPGRSSDVPFFSNSDVPSRDGTYNVYILAITAFRGV